MLSAIPGMQTVGHASGAQGGGRRRSSPRARTRWCSTSTSPKATASTCCARCARRHSRRRSTCSPTIRSTPTARWPSASARAASSTSRTSIDRLRDALAARQIGKRLPRISAGADRAPRGAPAHCRHAKFFWSKTPPPVRERLAAMLGGIPGARWSARPPTPTRRSATSSPPGPTSCCSTSASPSGSGFDVLRAVRRAGARDRLLHAVQLRRRALPPARRAARGARFLRQEPANSSACATSSPQRAAGNTAEGRRHASRHRPQAAERFKPAAAKFEVSCASCNLRELCLPGGAVHGGPASASRTSSTPAGA